MIRSSSLLLRRLNHAPRRAMPIANANYQVQLSGVRTLGRRCYSISAEVPSTTDSETPKNELQSNLRPTEIVAELNKFVVGQADAKRAVAIALRNRWRRRQLPEELRKEIMPRNVLLVGPTG